MKTHFNSKKWNDRFLKLAEHVSLWSKDPSTKVGSVITDQNKIVSLGFNGFPSGVDDAQNLYNSREEKYPRIIHAEMNAILMASRPIEGCVLYCTHVPCSQCAGAIIQKKISQVIIPPQDKEFLRRWSDPIAVTCKMLQEAGVEIFVLSEEYEWETTFHKMSGLVTFAYYRRAL